MRSARKDQSRALFVTLSRRARILNSDLNRDSAVMMSSTMPSAKYSDGRSCSEKTELTMKENYR
jgi:hypothetical protein